jgi:hypothetical protein
LFVDLGMWADRLRRRDWGLYPGSGWDGESGKMARVLGRAELGTISTDVLFGGLLTVGGTRVKDILGTLSRAGCEGESVKMSRVWVARTGY